MDPTKPKLWSSQQDTAQELVGKGMCISAPSKKPVRIPPQMEADNSQMLPKGMSLLINACDDVYLYVVPTSLTEYYASNNFSLAGS